MDALNPPVVSLLDIDFSNIPLDAILTRLLARPQQARFAYVVTPNADHIERLLRIPRLRGVYQRAMLCLLDSHVIAFAAKLLGLPTSRVVSGADLTEALLPRLEGLKVAVVGMQEADFALLAARFPGIVFVHHQPPMGLLHNNQAFHDAVDFVCATGAPFTFFAVGSPVQELLAYATASRSDSVGVGLCIGSALRFASGSLRRAPVWMRHSGLEWLHRLTQDPLRLAGRYLISDPKALLAMAVSAIREKKR
ncbi:WecB/TagA/CpsF family glycosyltransferase [Acidocella aromatica]|uniref:Exopolysaccharide biosynthesis WecB/TagA/CpsF family protein n=1 Tax=Acidocella aromatica TaxID=1303579 RepID=A0A840V9E4_9PROT|nr:WecB/TagA/CpsF family glycosyltransferase [Acidocella aromatica]MBB5372353.1 exopolysaccharide biosynthesis WecB/TagA/CpsF family protein [Acidocella aromatica]